MPLVQYQMDSQLFHPLSLSRDDYSPIITHLAEFYKDVVDSISLLFCRRHAEFRECRSILDLEAQKQLTLAYPNVICLYKLCLTLPVTTETTEHSFSKLKLVNTSLQSIMTEAWLSSLLIVSVERDIADKVTLDKVRAFAVNRPCRLSF